MWTSSPSSTNTTAVAVAITVVVGIVMIALLLERLSRRQSQAAGSENDLETLPENSKYDEVHFPQRGTSRQHSNDHRSGLTLQLPPSAYRGQQYPARNVISNPMNDSFCRGNDYRWSGEQRRETWPRQNQGVKTPVAAPVDLSGASTEIQSVSAEPFRNQDDSELQTLRERLRTLETAFVNQPSGVSRFADTVDRPPAYESRPGSPRVDQRRMRGEGA